MYLLAVFRLFQVLEVLSCDAEHCTVHPHDRYHYVGSKIIVQRLPLLPTTSEEATSTTYLPNLYICTQTTSTPLTEDIVITTSQESNARSRTPTPKKHVRIAEKNMSEVKAESSSEITDTFGEQLTGPMGTTVEQPTEQTDAKDEQESAGPSERLEPQDTTFQSSAVNTDNVDMVDSSIQTVSQEDESPVAKPAVDTRATNTEVVGLEDTSMQLSYHKEDVGVNTSLEEKVEVATVGVNTETADVATTSTQLSCKTEEAGINATACFAEASLQTSQSLGNFNTVGVNTDDHHLWKKLDSKAVDASQQTQTDLADVAVNTNKVCVVDSATSPEVQNVEETATEDTPTAQQITCASQTEDVEFKQYDGQDVSCQTETLAELESHSMQTSMIRFQDQPADTASHSMQTSITRFQDQPADPASTSEEQQPIFLPLSTRQLKLCLPAAKAASAGFRDLSSAASSANRDKGCGAFDLMRVCYNRCIRNPAEDPYEACGHYGAAAFENTSQKVVSVERMSVRQKSHGMTMDSESSSKLAIEEGESNVEVTKDNKSTVEKADNSCSKICTAASSVGTIKETTDHCRKKTKTDMTGTSTNTTASSKTGTKNTVRRSKSLERKQKTKHEVKSKEGGKRLSCRTRVDCKIKTSKEPKKPAQQEKLTAPTGNLSKTVKAAEKCLEGPKIDKSGLNRAPQKKELPCATKPTERPKDSEIKRAQKTNVTATQPVLTASTTAKPSRTHDAKDNEKESQNVKEKSPKEVYNSRKLRGPVPDRCVLFRELKDAVTKRESQRRKDNVNIAPTPRSLPSSEETCSEKSTSVSSQNASSTLQRQKIKPPQRVCIIPQQKDASKPPQKICFQTKREDGSKSTQRVCVIPQRKGGSKTHQKVCVIPQHKKLSDSSQKTCASHSQTASASCSQTGIKSQPQDNEEPKIHRGRSPLTEHIKQTLGSNSTYQATESTASEQKTFGICPLAQTEISQFRKLWLEHARQLPKTKTVPKVVSPVTDLKQSGKIHRDEDSQRKGCTRENLTQVLEDKENKSLEPKNAETKPEVKIPKSITDIYYKCMKAKSNLTQNKRLDITTTPQQHVGKGNERFDEQMTNTNRVSVTPNKRDPSSQSADASHYATTIRSQTNTQNPCLSKGYIGKQNEDNEYNPIKTLPLIFPFSSRSGTPGSSPPPDQDSSNSAENSRSEIRQVDKARPSLPKPERKEPYQSLSKASIKELSPPWEVSDRAKNNVFSPVGWTSPRSGITSLFRGHSTETLDSLGNDFAIQTDAKQVESVESSSSENKPGKPCSDGLAEDWSFPEESPTYKTPSTSTTQSPISMSLQQAKGRQSWESSTCELDSQKMCSSVKATKERHYCAFHPDMIELSRASAGDSHDTMGKQDVPPSCEYKPRIMSGPKCSRKSLSPGKRFLAVARNSFPSKPKQSQFIAQKSTGTHSVHVTEGQKATSENKQEPETNAPEKNVARLIESDTIQQDNDLSYFAPCEQEQASMGDQNDQVYACGLDSPLIRSVSGRYRLCKYTNDINEELKAKLNSSKRPSQLRRGKRKTDGKTSVHCENVRSQISCPLPVSMFGESASKANTLCSAPISGDPNVKHHSTSHKETSGSAEKATELEVKTAEKTLGVHQRTRSRLPVSSSAEAIRSKKSIRKCVTADECKITTESDAIHTNTRNSQIPVVKKPTEHHKTMQYDKTRSQHGNESATSNRSGTDSTSQSAAGSATPIASCDSITSETELFTLKTNRSVQKMSNGKSVKKIPSRLPLPLSTSKPESSHLKSSITVETKAVGPMIASRITQLQQSMAVSPTRISRDIKHIGKMAECLDNGADDFNLSDKGSVVDTAGSTNSKDSIFKNKDMTPFSGGRIKDSLIRSSQNASHDRTALHENMRNDLCEDQNPKQHFEREANRALCEPEGNISQNHNESIWTFGPGCTNQNISTELTLHLLSCFASTPDLSTIQALTSIDKVCVDELSSARSFSSDITDLVSPDLAPFTELSGPLNITEEIKSVATMTADQEYPSRLGQETHSARPQLKAFATEGHKPAVQKSNSCVFRHDFSKTHKRTLKRSCSASNLPLSSSFGLLTCYDFNTTCPASAEDNFFSQAQRSMASLSVESPAEKKRFHLGCKDMLKLGLPTTREA